MPSASKIWPSGGPIATDCYWAERLPWPRTAPSGVPVRPSHDRPFEATPQAPRQRAPGPEAEAVVAGGVRRMTVDGCS